MMIFPNYKLRALAWQYDDYRLNFMGIKPQVEHKTVFITVGMAYQRFVMDVKWSDLFFSNGKLLWTHVVQRYVHLSQSVQLI